MLGIDKFLRILVIGSSGNIAPSLLESLEKTYKDAEIVSTKSSEYNLMKYDEISSLCKFIKRFKPTITIFVSAVRDPAKFNTADKATQQSLFNLNCVAPLKIYKALQEIDEYSQFVFLSTIYVFSGNPAFEGRAPKIDAFLENSDYVDPSYFIELLEAYNSDKFGEINWTKNKYADGKRCVEHMLNELYNGKVYIAIVRMDGVLNPNSTSHLDNTFLDMLYKYLTAESENAKARLLLEYEKEVRYPVTTKEVIEVIFNSFGVPGINVYHVGGFYADKSGITKAEMVTAYINNTDEMVLMNRSQICTDRWMLKGYSNGENFMTIFSNTYNNIKNL
jgi:hypothetical protein